jgi:hypothetical protein
VQKTQRKRSPERLDLFISADQRDGSTATPANDHDRLLDERRRDFYPGGPFDCFRDAFAEPFRAAGGYFECRPPRDTA